MAPAVIGGVLRGGARSQSPARHIGWSALHDAGTATTVGDVSAGTCGPRGETLERVGAVGGLVAMYVINHRSRGLAELELPPDDPNESLYQRLKRCADTKTAGSRCMPEAVRGEGRLARLLELSIGAPLACAESVSWDSNVRPFDCYQAWPWSDRMRIDASVSSSPFTPEFSTPEIARGVA